MLVAEEEAVEGGEAVAEGGPVGVPDDPTATAAAAAPPEAGEGVARGRVVGPGGDTGERGGGNEGRATRRVCGRAGAETGTSVDVGGGTDVDAEGGLGMATGADGGAVGAGVWSPGEVVRDEGARRSVCGAGALAMLGSGSTLLRRLAGGGPCG